MENFSTNFDAYNKLALAKTNDTYSAIFHSRKQQIQLIKV